MRTVIGLVLSTTCLFLGANSYAQEDHCPARISSKNPTEKPLSAAEVAHHALINTPSKERRKLYWGDVEFILRCGTQQDGTELFSAVRNEYVRMNGATVFAAAQKYVRVSWDDGFNFGGFRFNFDQPLNVIPKQGQKIIISGVYTSYSREPFQINLTNSSLVFIPTKP